jgi:hypothetical protein
MFFDASVNSPFFAAFIFVAKSWKLFAGNQEATHRRFVYLGTLVVVGAGVSWDHDHIFEVLVGKIP